MVLIISSQEDTSTSAVIDWLIFLKIPFIRVNTESQIIISELTIKSGQESDFLLEINDHFGVNKIRYSELKFVWYRRGHLSLLDIPINEKLNYDFKNIKIFLETEKAKLVEFINFLFLKKPNINSYFDNSINKLIALTKAAECGLKIPHTCISMVSDNLKKLSLEMPIITKTIDNALIGKNSSNLIFSYTEVVNKNDITDEGSVFPSLIQEKLVKKYELRVFFLHGKFYESAIISQNNKKTMIDFRCYDEKTPNRVVPYKMPEKIRNNLSKLMESLRLNSGSIDIVVTKNNEYVFLEVNPIGQFWQVSYPCNYHLEREIALKIKSIL